MRLTAALLLVPLLGAAAEPPPAAAAQKQLATARAALAKAVQSTRKSEPTPAELEAAAAALLALTQVLERNAGLEAQDAPYAKSARAARRELVTQKVDVAVGRLNANAQHKGRVLTAENLKAAEAALAGLKTTLEEARPLGARDAGYARYLALVDGAVLRHEQAFDENWTRLLGERQRALSAATTALAEEASDAHRTAAGDAVAALSSFLEWTARAEERNAAYRAHAERARAELAAAKQRLSP